MPRKKSQNKNSGYKDKLFRIDAELAADLESIAEEQGTSQTTIVHEALKLYRDKRYMDIMNDGLNNTEQMYSPCIVCYRVNGVTILRSEETGELRGIEEPLETVCPYSVEEYALTKSLDAVLNKRDRKLLEKTINYDRRLGHPEAHVIMCIEHGKNLDEVIIVHEAKPEAPVLLDARDLGRLTPANIADMKVSANGRTLKTPYDGHYLGPEEENFVIV